MKVYICGAGDQTQHLTYAWQTQSLTHILSPAFALGGGGHE